MKIIFKIRLSIYKQCNYKNLKKNSHSPNLYRLFNNFRTPAQPSSTTTTTTTTTTTSRPVTTEPKLETIPKSNKVFEGCGSSKACFGMPVGCIDAGKSSNYLTIWVYHLNGFKLVTVVLTVGRRKQWPTIFSLSPESCLFNLSQLKSVLGRSFLYSMNQQSVFWLKQIEFIKLI